jgi:uncharacterized membrane protein (UPF0127 family)
VRAYRCRVGLTDAGTPRGRVRRLAAADGHVVVPRCELADGFLTRLRGLLGRRGLRPGEGLLLSPSSSVHTMFMRFPIDVVFLDRGLEVLGISADVRPWRLASRRGARHVLELAAGEAQARGIRAGDRLTFAALAAGTGEST